MAFFNKNKSRIANDDMPSFDPSLYQSEEDESEEGEGRHVEYVPPVESAAPKAEAKPVAAAPAKTEAVSVAPAAEAQQKADARSGRFSSLLRGKRQQDQPQTPIPVPPVQAAKSEAVVAAPAASAPAPSAPAAATSTVSAAPAPAARAEAPRPAASSPRVEFAAPRAPERPAAQQIAQPELRSPAQRVEMKPGLEARTPSASPAPQARAAEAPAPVRENPVRTENAARVEMKAEESRGNAAPGYRPMDGSNGGPTIAIDKNSKFSGQLKFAGTIAVDGQVEGEIVAERVLVHDGGAVSAKVESDSVLIAGRLNGDVFARKEVEITAGGELQGNVTAPSLSIKPGGSFEGRCSIGARR